MKKNLNVSAFKFKMLGENNVEIEATAVMQWVQFQTAETWIKFSSVKYKGVEILEILDGNHFGPGEGYTGTDVFRAAEVLSDQLVQFPEDQWEENFDIEIVKLSCRTNERAIKIPVSPKLTISALYDARKMNTANNAKKQLIMAGLTGFCLNGLRIDRNDSDFDYLYKLIGDPCYDCDVYESEKFFTSKKPLIAIPEKEMHKLSYLQSDQESAILLTAFLESKKQNLNVQSATITQ